MKKITAIFKWPELTPIITCEAQFATLPGSASAQWYISRSAPKSPEPVPQIVYAETFEREMRAIASGIGAAVEFEEEGEWTELSE